MSKTSRRNLLKVSAAAGVSAALGLAIKPETGVAEAESHKHQPIAGPLANATVSFGSGHDHWSCWASEVTVKATARNAALLSTFKMALDMCSSVPVLDY